MPLFLSRLPLAKFKASSFEDKDHDRSGRDQSRVGKHCRSDRASRYGRIADILAPGFVHRTHGGASADLETFLTGVSQIPGEILAVRLERLEIDLAETGALVTGIQYAQLRIDGRVVEDRRGFVNSFIKQAGEWRIQAAVDLPASP